MSVPRETDELQPVRISANGTVLLVGVELCILPHKARPTPASWSPAIVRDGKTCLRLVGLTPGYYDIWGRGNLGDEHAVLGPFPITID